MKAHILSASVAMVVACSASLSFAEENENTPSAADTGTTVYRQVLPDGRVVYSDKPVKGAKLDHTIKVDPAIRGNTWTTESAVKPVAPVQSERTRIDKVTSPPPLHRKKTYEEANSDVIRAEMLLEDAKKRQQAGIEPQAGERTGKVGGGSRLNPVYDRRQQSLAQEVEDAQAALRKAVEARDALRHSR